MFSFYFNNRFVISKQALTKLVKCLITNINVTDK